MPIRKEGCAADFAAVLQCTTSTSYVAQRSSGLFEIRVVRHGVTTWVHLGAIGDDLHCITEASCPGNAALVSGLNLSVMTGRVQYCEVVGFIECVCSWYRWNLMTVQIQCAI